MSLNRRQFLVLSGLTGGFGVAVLMQRTFAESAIQRSPAPSQSPPPKSATPTQPANANVGKAIAPQGMFAPPRGDVRIAVISDLNSQYGSTDYEAEVDKAIALIPAWQPDLVLCGGDMVAGQSQSLSDGEVQAMWAAFDRHIGAPLRKAKLPYGFTVGNHDASAALSSSGNFLFQRDRNLAAAHWNNPKHNPGLQFVDRGKFPFYYTFQQNGIFYLVWDASSAAIRADQLAWVEKSLASPAAQKAKLRIAIGHLPLYAVAVRRDRLGEILDQPDKLRSLLEKYRVHTYISGHHHAYFPGHRGKLELLHAGAIGAGPRRLLNSDRPPQKTLTIVDVKLGSASTTYTTYDMTTLQLVKHQDLPRIIVGPNGWVLRRDVQEADMTPEERSLI
ncbi:metallophosphoesterase [Trichocoleus sp. FACHB-262]|uniref:metallophosphoesterase family protein n=1 Tax=Trichocoleus sp. FACHB-262 TaxID=2692869 RepID=UPI001682C6C3|nr:metallophosphoesterase [Trichocoleus sp. FACHB-262]MBD2124526.1 metallophosphoesterase [Trichocoleus sp. FACHB-262]